MKWNIICHFFARYLTTIWLSWVVLVWYEVTSQTLLNLLLKIYKRCFHLRLRSLYFEGLVTIDLRLSKSLKSWLLMLTHILRIKFFNICPDVFFLWFIQFFVTINFANSYLWLCSFLIWWRAIVSLLDLEWWSPFTAINLFIKPHLKLNQLPFHLLKHFVIPRSFMSFFYLAF